MKKEVYLNEFNVLMDNATYLPLASGQLRAYAESIPIIRDAYEFMPFIFLRDKPEKILSLYQNPSVAGFSCSMWNINLSLAVAERVKAKFPNCLIVFGGPQVPHEASDFLKRHPFVDVTVRGEGEHQFADLLVTRTMPSSVAGTTSSVHFGPSIMPYRPTDRPLEENLDTFPSPYLEGLYDELLASGINFNVVIETNRGCPFRCKFCFWGGEEARMRLYSMERVKQVIEWCAQHKIEYVFCADSNFGMLKRDVEIARYLIEAKEQYGFPKKFRACYGKNAEEHIFTIGKMLHKQDMEKGITLSLQTTSPEALESVGRKNIKLSTYRNLQQRYNQAGIPIYTELILGLPGETYESFLQGIEGTLGAGIKNQLMVYICQVLPNTQLADPVYREKFQIRTQMVPLTETHASVRPTGIPVEYEEIIVATASMRTLDWERCLVVSWIMQLLHGLKLAFYPMLYLAHRYGMKYADFFDWLSKLTPEDAPVLGKEIKRFYQIAHGLLRGQPSGQAIDGVYWEPEEAAYLSIIQKKKRFYLELYRLCKEYLARFKALPKGWETELWEVIQYQAVRVPDRLPPESAFTFQHNVPEFFDRYFSDSPCELIQSPQAMVVERKEYADRAALAREVIMHGRKSDKMLYRVRWRAI